MLCPNCLGKTRVQGTKSEMKTERYRFCPSCKYSFKTIEKATKEVNTPFFWTKNRKYTP